MSAVEYETESDKDGLPVHDERGGLGYTQQASIDRIIDDHPPVPRIDRDVCPEPFGLRPSECPIVYWGFPYKKGYLERYAVRHSLSTREYPALRDVAGPGRQTIQFGEGGMVEGDVPPSAFEALTQDAALADMERKSVVLDNRNILRDQMAPKVLGRGVKVLKDAMNEEGHESEPMWCWSW